MKAEVGPEARQDARYEIAGGQPAILTLDAADHRCEPLVFQARLVNLSQSGAKLSVPVELPLSKHVRLQLAVEEFAMAFYLTAEVCWCAPCDDGQWEIGCSLSPQIPPTLFAVLAGGGRLDRRQVVRYDDNRELLALRELDGVKQPVTLRDYSDGGFCVLASSPGTPGERVHICISGPEERMVVAKIQWQLKLADCYLLGCTFLNPKDADHLSKAAT